MEQMRNTDGSLALIKKSYLIMTVVAFFVVTGIGIGVSQTQLASKMDESSTRKVIKEEISNQLQYYYSDKDGSVLKSEVDNLKQQIDRLEKILEKIK
jgi:hypothetical protein